MVLHAGSLSRATNERLDVRLRPPTVMFAQVLVLRIADQNVVVLTLSSGRSDVVLGDTPQLEWAAHKSNGKLCVAGTFRTAHSLAGIAVRNHHHTRDGPVDADR